MTAVIAVPTAQPNTMRLVTTGTRLIPNVKMLKWYRTKATTAISVTVIEILINPHTIIATTNSVRVTGVTKMLMRLRVHSSVRNDTEIACWTRKNKSHRMRAPSNTAANSGTPPSVLRYSERNPKKNRSSSGQ